MSGYPWTDVEITILEQRYPYTFTKNFMHLLPDRSYRAIEGKAKRLGLYKLPGALRKCDIDDTFFSAITPVSAYWAGFLAADGYIDGYDVRIGIHVRDLGHLERFRDTIAPDKYIGLSGKRVSLTLRSPQMCEDLARIYGIVPRKSLILPAPQVFDECCAAGYIAGLLDGDGCVNDYRHMSWLGTHDVLEWVRGWLEFWPNGPRARVLVRGKIYGYSIGIGRAAHLARLVWDLRLPVLKRKWNRIWAYLETRNAF